MFRRYALAVVLLAPGAASCLSVLGLDFEPTVRAGAPEAPDGGDVGVASDPTAPPPSDSSTDASAGPREDGATLDAGSRIVVDVVAKGRDRVGARSTVGFRPWRGGIYASNGVVYWVESGGQAGLYAASDSPDQPQKLAALTRPSAFAVGERALYVADVNRIVRYAVPIGPEMPPIVASATEEIGNLAAAPGAVFWTSGDGSAIRRTADGTTSTPIHSNGTPVGMAGAGNKVFWVGVDISGQNGALQSIGSDGQSPNAVTSVNGGFHAIAGNATYLYYAKGEPTTLVRRTVATGRVETVASDALGIRDIVVGSDYAYWVEPGDAPDYANGRVRRVAHEETVPVTLAVSIAMPLAIALDGSTVYVASAGTRAANRSDGKILRITEMR